MLTKIQRLFIWLVIYGGFKVLMAIYILTFYSQLAYSCSRKCYPLNLIPSFNRKNKSTLPTYCYGQLSCHKIQRSVCSTAIFFIWDQRKECKRQQYVALENDVFTASKTTVQMKMNENLDFPFKQKIVTVYYHKREWNKNKSTPS